MRMNRKTGEEDRGSGSGSDAGQDEKRKRCSARWMMICARHGAPGTRETMPRGKPSQKRMVALLDRRRYLSNLVRDVTETLGA